MSFDPHAYANTLAEIFSPEAIEEALAGQNDFSEYQDDPVRFGEEILGETYTDEVKALMRSVRDNPNTVGKSANAVGKTHAAARIAVWWYLCFPDSQVYTGAAPPEGNLRRLLWGEIGSIVEKHLSLFVGHTVTTLHIQRHAQSFLTGVTIPQSGTEAIREAKFSGKHSPNLLFVFDEGDAIPDECYRGAESCMSGGHARQLTIFNPRMESGPIYRMERDRKARVIQLSAFNHPNVLEGKDIIPGAVTRETTVRRIHEWARPLAAGEQPNSECFELPDFLVGAVATSQAGKKYPPLAPGWYRITDPAFSYMVLGQYPAQASTQLISREWVNRARARWDFYVSKKGEVAPRYTKAVLGLDIAEFGTDANVLCARYGGFLERLITWDGIDTIESAEKAAAEYKARNSARANVDATGVGAGVAPYMQRLGCAAIPVMVASSPTERTALGEFKILRDQLYWAVREWLRTDPGAMLPPDELLLEELLTPTYEVEGGKIRIMKKAMIKELIQRSCDRADALALTFAPSGLLDGCDLT